MARPILIIDMGRESVRCCALVAGRSAAEVNFETTLNGDMKGAVTRLLKEMEGAGFGAFGRVYLGVPADSVTMRVVQVALDDRKKVGEVLPFELEESLVRGTEDFIFDAATLSDGRVLAVALEKTVLRQ